MVSLKLMVCKHSDQNACHPCARPNSAKRLRRCRLCRSNSPAIQFRHRPMVRRLGGISRVTLRTDPPTLNRSNTACWLFHQYWRHGDKHEGRREHVPRHAGQINRRIINRPTAKDNPSPRGALRS